MRPSSSSGARSAMSGRMCKSTSWDWDITSADSTIRTNNKQSTCNWLSKAASTSSSWTVTTQQDALQAPADALNQQQLQVQNQARGFEQQRVQANRQLQGLVQQRAQAQREANKRAEQQRLQAEYQQRQANEIRVAEEYVKKSEPQKLAEAINNTIVVYTDNTFVAGAQKEVIREKSALVMQNPEKHAVELAKELNTSQL